MIETTIVLANGTELQVRGTPIQEYGFWTLAEVYSEVQNPRTKDWSVITNDDIADTAFSTLCRQAPTWHPEL